MRRDPLCLRGAALVLMTWLATVPPAGAQQIGSDLSVVNNLKKEIKVVRIAAYQVKDGQPVPVGGSDVDLAQELAPGAQVKMPLQADVKARDCGTWIVRYEIRGGSSGGRMLDLCGKTRIVFGGDDSDFPEISAE